MAKTVPSSVMLIPLFERVKLADAKYSTVREHTIVYSSILELSYLTLQEVRVVPNVMG